MLEPPGSSTIKKNESAGSGTAGFPHLSMIVEETAAAAYWRIREAAAGREIWGETGING